MQAGFEFLATSAIFALVFVTWMVYESVQAWKRHSRRNVIRESRYFQQGREIRSGHDCWEIDGTRVR